MFRKTALLGMLLPCVCQLAAVGAVPLRIHPQNPRVFEFRGRPLVLITATEHYGAVLNRPFNFERYLADAADKGMTLTRLFILFRELQTPLNPYSTCKPESTDYVAPYPRTGPGLATDRLPRFDLDRWNPEFFDRLHRFLAAAERQGIVVEVTLLSNTYADNIWAFPPLNPLNNINGTETIQPAEYLSQRHPRLFARQQTLVRKVVAECNRYDNVIFELCNEPNARLPAKLPPGERQNPNAVEMDRWLTEIARTVRDTERGLPHRHLLSGQASYTWPPTPPTVGLSLTASFTSLPVEVVNVHNDRSITWQGTCFDLGGFMMGELRLAGLRGLFLATAGQSKPLNLDEDNAASRSTDVTGWTVHRKRAWTTVLNGGHYDMIDFTIRNYLETGTPASQQHIRAWLKHLSVFVHSLDLVRARPMPEVVRSSPPQTIASVLAVAGEDYAVYLADGREADQRGLGDPLRGELALTLPGGRWQATFIDPTTGQASPGPAFAGGETRLGLPAFRHDLVVRLKR